MCYCPTPTLYLNLALTGDGAFLFSLKKTHSVWFISILNYGDTENVLINHLLLVIPMSYPCHYTNLCPHKPHKHAHTHTHTHTHTCHILCRHSIGLIIVILYKHHFTSSHMSIYRYYKTHNTHSSLTHIFLSVVYDDKICSSLCTVSSALSPALLLIGNVVKTVFIV